MSRARFGFCGNVAEQECQNGDNDDADFAIGIGCTGQTPPQGHSQKKWGAGFNDYYQKSYPPEFPVEYDGPHTFQAWVYAVNAPPELYTPGSTTVIP